MPVLLGIDVGTSGARAVAFDARGRALASHRVEYGVLRPTAGAVEQDWRVLEKAMLRSLERVRRILGGRASGLAGVAVTNQRETFVPLDRQGRPVGRALVWQDSRAVEQCAQIRRKIGAREIYRRTGLRVHTYFTLPKLMWLRHNRPAIWKKTSRIALVHDIAVMRLVGSRSPVTDPSNASRTMLWNLVHGAWDLSVASRTGIDPDILPDVSECGSPLGELRVPGWPRAPVFAGGGDQQCAALGVGVTRPGAAKATFGTGTFLLAQTRGPKFDRRMRTIATRHCVRGEFAAEVSQFSAGTSFRWVRDNFYPELANRQEGYSRIAADAARSSEARPHFVPYLSGAGAPHWSHGARGALAGLSFDHGRREIAAAVLEGVAREAAVGASQLRSQGARSLVIDGGLTRSARFARLFAALSPLPVFRSRVVEATALGAAMIAAVGTGAHRDLRSAVAAMVARPARVPTDPGSMRGLALRQEEWSFWAANALDPEDR